MKKNVLKGFTLIELIIVIGIIAVLAGILVPIMVGYTKDARIQKYNSNASIVYTAASAKLTSQNSTGVYFKPNTVYLGVDSGTAVSADGSQTIEINPFVGDEYYGYYGFLVDDRCVQIQAAVWSTVPLDASDVKRYTEQEVIDSFETSKPLGCKY
ncbi:MAG: prepilin-type N-terminal cleavage/methylation domain-containing protein [Huintestinicola sp.]